MQVSEHDEVTNIELPVAAEAMAVLKRFRARLPVCERKVLNDLIERLEAFTSERYEPEMFSRAYTQALGEQSIKRHPVVNAYLAQ